MKKEIKFMAVDAILVILSLYMALLLKFDFKIEPLYNKFLLVSIIPLIVFTIIFNVIFKLYKNIWKYASISELLNIVYSVTLTNVVFVIYGYFITYGILKHRYYRFPRSVHAIFWILSIVSLCGIRCIYRISENANSGKVSGNSKKLLIVGGGDAAAILIKEIQSNPSLDYNVVGVIDDNLDKINKTIRGVTVLGDRNSILSVCKEYKVDEIMIAMPSVDKSIQKDIIDICEKYTDKIKVMPGIYTWIDDSINMKHMRDVEAADLLGRDPIKLKSEHIDKYIKGKTILVTGGGGSIGSEIVRQIVRFKPKKIVILDIYENNAYDLQMELNRTHPEIDKNVVIASVRDYVRMQQIFELFMPDVVFHAAAHKHVPLMEDNVGDAIKNNILGTYNIARCCDKYKVKKFVLISTDKAVNPTNVMGATKRFCELIMEAFNEVSDTDYVAVRFGNVLGSNGSVIPLFKKQIEKGGPVTVTHPDITRFFMTIPEAAQLVIQAGGFAEGGEIFVLDMGKPVKMVDLARELIKLSGYRPDIDIKIEFVGLRPGEKLYEELLMDEKGLDCTEHDKIFVEKPKDADMDFIKKSIDEFNKVDDMTREEMIQILSEKVPTFNHKENREVEKEVASSEDK